VTFAASVAGLPTAAAADAVAAFGNVLLAVGTPSFSDVAASVGPADIRPYLDGYTAGLNYAFFVCGPVGVIGGVIALLAFGQQDPLKTRWDNRDERASAGATIAS
jgi:hypothetical protein